jgi:autotransporter passenger strand-loop-strand repeat protein
VARVSSGGTENVSGVTQNTSVGDGGSVTVFSGGVANNSLIQSGGYELVMSGGAFSGATLAGGTLEIASGGNSLSSTIEFAGDGKLILDSTRFRGKLDAFTLGDTIDLLTVAYGSSTTSSYVDAGTSGTLTVTDGTHTARLTLLGQYQLGNFTVANNGGHVQITDPPVSSGGGNLVTPH